MSEQEQVATPVDVAQPSEIETPVEQVAADTTEPVAESDEQKNQRELADRQKRSERAQRGIQKRLDELTADKYAERQRAERAERMLEQMSQPRQSQQPSNVPTREQFADYESYLEAKAEWKAGLSAQSAVQAALQQLEQRTQGQAQQNHALQVRQQFETKMAEFAKATPDWDDVVANNDEVNIPNEAAALLHQMPDGAQIMYAIGKNPALAKQLNGNAIQQAMALGQISAALKTSPQVSKAPPPGTPVGSKPGSASEPPADPDAYMAWAAKHMR